MFFEEQAADRLCFAPSPYGALPLAGPMVAARTAPRGMEVSRGQGGISQPSQRAGGDFFSLQLPKGSSLECGVLTLVVPDMASP